MIMAMPMAIHFFGNGNGNGNGVIAARSTFSEAGLLDHNCNSESG